MDLCSLTAVRELLAENSLSPRKSLGQNFLINPRVPVMIAERAAELARNTASGDAPIGVIEIGPGIGALTASLADRFDRVVALEIDPGLSSLFLKTFAERDNVKLISGDVMKTDVTELLEENFRDLIAEGGSVGVCANLPYYITTPVIMKLLESFDPVKPCPLSAITVMIQSEVADRLSAREGTPDYGSITASVALRANVAKNFDVSPGSFYPQPKVTSTVISIVPHGGIREVFPDSPDDDGECREFFKTVSEIIEASFAQRRKTLTNALSGLYPKESVSAALDKTGKNRDIRGEKLSAYDFCALGFQLYGEKDK